MTKAIQVTQEVNLHHNPATTKKSSSTILKVQETKESRSKLPKRKALIKNEN